MARLYLVRHGEPSGTWTDSADPGLSTLGHEQAEMAAQRLRAFGGLEIVTSPLRRAQETAAPFAAQRGIAPTISAAVSEIPTPVGVPFEKRGDWLRAVMTGKWHDTEQTLQNWRGQLIDYLLGLRPDTAVFSHYVAINVAAAAARGEERVTVFAPTHASITIFGTSPRGLQEIELGHSGQTTVR